MSLSPHLAFRMSPSAASGSAHRCHRLRRQHRLLRRRSRRPSAAGSARPVPPRSRALSERVWWRCTRRLCVLERSRRRGVCVCGEAVDALHPRCRTVHGCTCSDSVVGRSWWWVRWCFGLWRCSTARCRCLRHRCLPLRRTSGASSSASVSGVSSSPVLLAVNSSLSESS